MKRRGGIPRAQVSDPARAVAKQMCKNKKRKTPAVTRREVGGFTLAWDPMGEKRLERYATQEERDEFVHKGKYSLVNYGGSTKKAVWFKVIGGSYAADFASERPWTVLIDVLIDTDTPFIHVENQDFVGEAQHPNQVIVKNNEIDAYGIGRGLIDKLNPRWEKKT